MSIRSDGSRECSARRAEFEDNQPRRLDLRGDEARSSSRKAMNASRAACSLLASRRSAASKRCLSNRAGQSGSSGAVPRDDGRSEPGLPRPRRGAARRRRRAAAPGVDADRSGDLEADRQSGARRDARHGQGGRAPDIERPGVAHEDELARPERVGLGRELGEAGRATGTLGATVRSTPSNIARAPRCMCWRCCHFSMYSAAVTSPLLIPPVRGGEAEELSSAVVTWPAWRHRLQVHHR
jgi:hypothetical protein